MSEVRISEQARADPADIWLFIARENLGAADRQVASVLDTSRRLADAPEMGEKRDELAPGLRQFTVRPRYVIFYRPIEGGIELVRVVGGGRDIDALF